MSLYLVVFPGCGVDIYGVRLGAGFLGENLFRGHAKGPDNHLQVFDLADLGLGMNTEARGMVDFAEELDARTYHIF